MSKIYYQFDDIKYHFKNNFAYYVLIGIFAFVGVAVGIYLSIAKTSYFSILKLSDRNMLAYINGTASYLEIFYSHLIDILLALLIIVVLSLNKFTCLLGNLFLSYQMALIILCGASVISLYGLTGILNFVFFILPINLCNFCVLSFALGFGHERAKIQSDYKLSFASSFRENGYFFKLMLCIITLIILSFVSSVILPIFIKSFVVISF